MDSKEFIRYLDGKMDQDEIKSFEENLEKDPLLQKELHEIKQMKEFAASKSGETNSLLAAEEVYLEMKNKRKHEDSDPPKKTNFLKVFLPIAAAAIVLLFLLNKSLFQNMVPGSQDVYADYFTPVPISLVKRNQENQELQKKIETHFNSSNYLQAKLELDQLIQMDPNNQKLHLYRAISALETNELPNAKQTLIELSQNPLYNVEAKYFLALCYIKEDNTESALEYLNSLLPESSRAEEATQLIKLLKK